MSTDDYALFEALPFGREEVLDRLTGIFAQHQVRFSGMARGATWDPPRGIRYGLEQDLEDLDSPREALVTAADWPGLILDVDREHLDFEVFLFHGAAPREKQEVVCLRYAQRSLFNQEPDRVEGFRQLLQDIGIALGSAAMICGSKVASGAYTARELEDAFAKHVSVPVDREYYFIHTVFFRDEVFDRLKDAPGLASYGRQAIGPNYQMASLLLPAP